MLWTTPSLLSLVPGLILAVEFFASEKPSGKPLGCSATACYWCSKTEAQAWWCPQPHRAGKGFPSTRGRAVSVQMLILQWREQGKAPCTPTRSVQTSHLAARRHRTPAASQSPSSLAQPPREQQLCPAPTHQLSRAQEGLG